MAMRPSKIETVIDSSDSSKIQPSEMNPATEPGVPSRKDIWFDIQDTYISIKVYKGGAWREVAKIEGDYAEP